MPGQRSTRLALTPVMWRALCREQKMLMRASGNGWGVRHTGRFYDECKRRYSLKLWKAFNMVFNCLPIAAIVSFDTLVFPTCCLSREQRQNLIESIGEYQLR